ncbi:hypothetical protein MKW92_053341, partial [Papaver armeniacum]
MVGSWSMMPEERPDIRNMYGRERIEAEYFRKNPLNKELFILDIARYSSIYVCSF